jgi:thiol-disulfide isomerase/thioredoxin
VRGNENLSCVSMAAFPKTVEIILTAAITLVMLLVLPNQSFVEGPIKNNEANGVLKGVDSSGKGYAPWIRIWWPYTVHSALWRLANVNTKETMLPKEYQDVLSGTSWLSTNGQFHPSADTTKHGGAPAFKVKKSKSGSGFTDITDNKVAKAVHAATEKAPAMIVIRAVGCPPCKAVEGECQKVFDAAKAGETAMHVADVHINDKYKDDVSELAQMLGLTSLGTPFYGVFDKGELKHEHKGDRSYESLMKMMKEYSTSKPSKSKGSAVAANRVVVDRAGDSGPVASESDPLLQGFTPKPLGNARTNGSAYALDALESAPQHDAPAHDPTTLPGGREPEGMIGATAPNTDPLPRGREPGGMVDAPVRAPAAPGSVFETPDTVASGPHDPWLNPAPSGRGAPGALLGAA